MRRNLEEPVQLKPGRQPLALIQETVHALTMQSSLQFSMPSGFQARVAAATTLSQGGLGQMAHHTLPQQPVPLPSHSPQVNSQSSHSVPSDGATNQFQRLKVEDALSYLDQVKYKFGNQPQVYNDFLDIMKEFKSQSIDTPGVIQRVSTLFRGHAELIVGFNTFLPPGYRIEVQDNERVQVSVPGTEAITILPPPISPPPATKVSSSHPAPPSNSQPTGQNTYSQNSSPAHSQPSPNGGSQPVEFNHAINYVNKIKNRFQGQPDIYKQFLEILHTYQKEQRNQKESIALVKPLTEAEVYSQVAKLFQNQEDLLQEFGQFLPDANGAANVLVNLQPLKSLNSDHSLRSVDKKPLHSKAALLSSSVQPPKLLAPASLKRPLAPASPLKVKRQRMTVLKDVSLAEASKFTSLADCAFFDRVRQNMENKSKYNLFLRGILVYNLDIVNKHDLVGMTSPFLSKSPDLCKWLKDFVNFKEFADPDFMPIKMEERERGEFSTEIDYQSCQKIGASYRAVPRNFVQPKCSGRTAICREVLNDSWVSFPSWSEDSSFVSSRKTQFEEYIYRCEDERFELDMVLETNLSTIHVLELEMSKISRMSAEEKARYRLDETLGGSSPTIHHRAIRRIYGDKASDVIDGLKNNPASSVPLVLRRLHFKDEEWRVAQKCYNKIWREQNEKFYLKSLDHQGLIFKQADVKSLRSKNILNEIENFYEERHDKAEEEGITETGPHITLTYTSWSVFKEAADLIIHHVKRQTGIHKEDKQKVKQLMRQFVPDFFFISRQELSDDEIDKDDDIDDGNDSGMYLDLLTLKSACKTAEKMEAEEKAEATKEETKQSLEEPASEGGTVMFANNNWYLFFRLHHILCERLHRISGIAHGLLAQELKDREERKHSTALALRLKPRNQIGVESYFSAFLEMVQGLLDGNMDNSQFEDNLRDMFGINAYLGFTTDKMVQNAVRQLQHLVGDDSVNQFLTLFLEEGKKLPEAVYQKKAEQMCDDNLYKIAMLKETGQLTIELLDTETCEESDLGNKWNAFVHRYTREEGLVNKIKDRLMKSPIFRHNQAKKWHDKQLKEQEVVAQPEEEEPEIDLRGLEDGRAGDAVRGLVGLNSARRPQKCRLDVRSYRMTWIAESEDFFFRLKFLERARQSHRDVSMRQHKKFREVHEQWLECNVTQAQRTQHDDWMSGRAEDTKPTTVIHVDRTDQPPYVPYNRYTRTKT